MLKKLTQTLSERSRGLFKKKGAEPVVTLDPNDPASELIAITSRKLGVDLAHAKNHPFINFINGCFKRADELERRNVQKAVENFSKYLDSLPDNGDEKALEFYTFFASRQGLFLYRCSLISIRYFSRMLNKLSETPKAIHNIFISLKTPEIVDSKGLYDILLQKILTNQDLTMLNSTDDIRTYTKSIIEQTS